MEIAYAAQFALAANGEISYSKLGRGQPQALIVERLPGNFELHHNLEEASNFGLWTWLMSSAALGTDAGATRIAHNPAFREILSEQPDPPEFESLSEESDADADKEEPEKTGEQEKDTFVAPKGFLNEFFFTAWSVHFPLLLDSLVNPESESLDKAVAGAMSDTALTSSSLLAPQAGAVPPDFAVAQKNEMLDLALAALARKHYRAAISRLAQYERMVLPGLVLGHVQVAYVQAMCYRGLHDTRHEEALLRSATAQLGTPCRLGATRSASLRLNDLRQLIEEEYLAVLYREHKTAAMAAALAEYRSASLLPAAVIAASPRGPLAEELTDLRDAYDALNEREQGSVDSPVTREQYKQLLAVFNAPQNLPGDDPTKDAIEQATFLVTDELYAGLPHKARAASSIRAAGKGELLILIATGASGIHSVTIDENRRVNAFYRYVPLSRLEALSRDFSIAIRDNLDASAAGSQLFQLLFAHLPELKGERRISILADGTLQQLPWAAIPGAEKEGRSSMISRWPSFQVSLRRRGSNVRLVLQDCCLSRTSTLRPSKGRLIPILTEFRVPFLCRCPREG